MESQLPLQKMSEKLKKIDIHYQEYGSSLKFDFPPILVICSISRKKLRVKILFPVDKKLIFTSENEGLVEKYVSVEKKFVSPGNCWPLFEKMEENGLKIGFPLISISRKKVIF